MQLVRKLREALQVACETTQIAHGGEQMHAKRSRVQHSFCVSELAGECDRLISSGEQRFQFRRLPAQPESDAQRGLERLRIADSAREL